MKPQQEIQPWEQTVVTRTRTYSSLGYLTIVGFIGVFGYWAATAPLAGAAIASGVVAAAGQNIFVQHLEGGIVDEIKVREGDQVRAGEPMLVLDSTVAMSQLNRLLKQLVALKAKAVRLEAERDGAEEINMASASLPASSALDASDVVLEQRKEFVARLARYRTEQQILNQRVAALNEAVEGLEAQKNASEKQLVVVEDEILRKKDLLDQGLTNRSEYSALLRSQAELVGQIGSIQSQIASSSIQAIEAREQIERLTTSRVETAVAELNTVRASIADVEEQVLAAASIAKRTEVRAPVDGVVVRAVPNSKGVVVRAGEPIFELLPTAGSLIVEARVKPQDVDAMRVGQAVQMRFTALNMRKTPEVPGKITYISADRRVDQSTDQAFYTVRVRIADDLPAEIDANQIYPGMPVEAFISTGERTFVEYLMKPLYDSFSRAFREE
jgi:HlyD family secretion protein